MSGDRWKTIGRVITGPPSPTRKERREARRKARRILKKQRRRSQ